MRNISIIITEQQLQDVINQIILKQFGFGDEDIDSKSEVEVGIDGGDTEDISTLKISEKGQQLLNNQTFKTKLDEISKALGISKNSIIKLMQHESRLNPTIKNSIGCVGLIQFCPDNRGGNTKTISGKQYNLSELQNNLGLQLDAIKEFWLTGKKSGKIKDAKDLYTYNLFPIAAGKSDDFVLQSNSMSAQTVAKANPIFNKTLGRPVNTPLTVGDLNKYYEMKNMV